MLLLQEGRINPGYLCDTNNWSLFRSYWSTIYWSPHLFFMMRIISKTLHDYCICFHYRCYSHHSYVRADYHGDVVVFTITCHHHHHHISSVCLSNFSLVIITKSITIIFPPLLVIIINPPLPYCQWTKFCTGLDSNSAINSNNQFQHVYNPNWCGNSSSTVLS